MGVSDPFASNLPTCAVLLVLGKVKAGPAVTGYPTFGRLPADVGTAVVFVHAVHPLWEERQKRQGLETSDSGREKRTSGCGEMTSSPAQRWVC